MQRTENPPILVQFQGSALKHYGLVVELADTSDLGSDAERRGGSSPFLVTNISLGGGIGRHAGLRSPCHWREGSSPS